MFNFQEQPATESAVLAASIGSAILYLAIVRSSPSSWRMTVKAASTALLSGVAAMRGGSLLLVGALALGSIGDAFLAWDDDTSFLCGLASFLVAHILYIVLFCQKNTNSTAIYQVLSEGWRAITAGALTLLVPIMIALLIPRVGSELRLPLVLYSLTVFVMVVMALTMDSSQLIFGAVMFCSSDSILAADRFLVSPTSPSRAFLQPAVWMLYFSGQMLIALGILSFDA